MNGKHWLILLIAMGGLYFTGCGAKSPESASHAEGGKHEEGEGGGSVTFKEGRGLALNADVIRALGLKTVEAEDRPLTGELKLLAHVFATAPQVLVSASMPEEEAQMLEKQTFTGAKLVRIDRAGASGTRRVDAVFAVDLSPAPKEGEFVELKLAGQPRQVLSVPHSAILDGASGKFVYVVNGEFYLRSAVKTGASSTDFVEITDGLYAGDAVVTTSVNQLWLSELRLTKGGGHSH